MESKESSGESEKFMTKDKLNLTMYKTHETYHTHELETGTCECGARILGIRFDEPFNMYKYEISLGYILFVSSYVFRTTINDILLENFLRNHKDVQDWIIRLLKAADLTKDQFLISNARKSLDYLKKLMGEELDGKARF